MRHLLSLMSMLLLGWTELHAEPIPWSFELSLTPTTGASAILLGQQPVAGSSAALQSLLYTLGDSDLMQSGSQLDLGSQNLFRFSQNSPLFSVTQTPPPAGQLSLNEFELHWSFMGLSGDTVSGVSDGKVSISPTTGNFSIWLDQSEHISLDGYQAIVRFSGDNSQQPDADVMMDVTLLDSPPPPDPVQNPTQQVPEPGTVILASVGLAGVAWWRTRRSAPQLAHSEQISR